MFDERTATLALPLPHPQNDLFEDVARLRSAFGLIDARFAAIAALLAADDLTLDTVLEIANAIKANRADITEVIADKVSTAVFTAALLGKADAVATAAALALKSDAAAVTAALAGKSATGHGHALADVVGLIEALTAKADGVTTALALGSKADADATTAALASKADDAATAASIATKLPIGSTRKTASFAAVSGVNYRIDNSIAGITATLPAAPADDARIGFTMGGGTQTWIVARNGNKIAGIAEDLTVDLFRGGFALRYDGAANGWVIE